MKTLLWLALCAAALGAQTPKTELLYPAGAPGAVGSEPADQPSITWWAAPDPNGTAILICPGGGYQTLAMDHEGQQIAAYFNSLGATAIVLKYRLGPRYHHPAMIDDARAAMRAIRAQTAAYKIDPGRVGVIGFSAGGHLASTLSTHYQAGERPDFAVLVYPVISMLNQYTHSGSLRNLLGDKPDPSQQWLLSNELQVTPQTPPTFLFHTANDPVVPVENSVQYFLALRRAGVKAEMHIYQNGPHGVGLARNDAILSTWPARLKDWLILNGFLPAAR